MLIKNMLMFFICKNTISEKDILMGSVRDRVHAAHCCLKCGCKYGDDDCPVCSGRVEQKYPCEFCKEEKPDYSVRPPTIEWVGPNVPDPPQPPPTRKINEDISKGAFIKGFLLAFFIIVVIQIVYWQFI